MTGLTLMIPLNLTFSRQNHENLLNYTVKISFKLKSAVYLHSHALCPSGYIKIRTKITSEIIREPNFVIK